MTGQSCIPKPWHICDEKTRPFIIIYLYSGYIGTSPNVTKPSQKKPKKCSGPMMWWRGVSHGGISNHSWTNPPREDFEDPTKKKTAGWRPPIAFANLKRSLSIYVYIYIFIDFSTINATVELTTFTSSDNKLEHHLVVRLITVMSPWNSINKNWFNTAVFAGVFNVFVEYP